MFLAMPWKRHEKVVGRVLKHRNHPWRTAWGFARFYEVVWLRQLGELKHSSVICWSLVLLTATSLALTLVTAGVAQDTEHLHDHTALMGFLCHFNRNRLQAEATWGAG